MKLTIQEVQVLEWRIDDLIARAEKIEELTGITYCSYRKEAAIIRNLIERGTHEEEESD